MITIGMENGSIPNSNATTDEAVAEEARVLAAMLSHARHGVVLNYARRFPTLAGSVRLQQPSRFFGLLRSAGLQDASGIVE